jgi:plasmid stability protein
MRARCSTLQLGASWAGIEMLFELVPLFAASIVLAFCDMATLYLRNVPDAVVDRLQRLAAREGASVNAIAVRELTESSKRADNPALLGALPDLAVDAKTIVAELEAERSRR